MADSPDPGIDRLLARVRPRWDQERHERNFAAILRRLRDEDGRSGGLAMAGRRLRLNHASR